MIVIYSGGNGTQKMVILRNITISIFFKYTN
jgi:hypothetical protein